MLFIILIVTLLSTLACSSTIHVRILNKGITVIVEYGSTILSLNKNSTVQVPNSSVTILAYTNDIGYNIEINNNESSVVQINPNNVSWLNVSLVPNYVYLNLSIDGPGEIIAKLYNGSIIVINKSTELKLIEGTTLTLQPKASKGYTFDSWSNLSNYPRYWIIAYGNTSVTAIFSKYKGTPITIPKYEFAGLAFFGILGAIYLINKRNK
ncbi:hypothetical protein DFR85_01740 [Acidianus brierleyi]|nr:hypothetical protein DFR85_01740 [Acidianus brierleyi]